MKTIFALACFSLLGVSAGLGLADCTVVTADESCISGPCELPTTTSVSTSAAGSTGSGADSGPSGGDYPCAIYDIVTRRCNVACHSPEKLTATGAPFSLTTWEDTQLPLSAFNPKLRAKRMAELIIPGVPNHMPLGCPGAACSPAGDLTTDEETALETYLTSGAKAVAQGTDQKCTELCGTTPCVPQ